MRRWLLADFGADRSKDEDSRVRIIQIAVTRSKAVELSEA